MLNKAQKPLSRDPGEYCSDRSLQACFLFGLFLIESLADIICCQQHINISTTTVAELQVDFDTELDLGPFMSNRRGPPQPYSLYGVLVHSGHSVHSGHYYAFVKAPNGLWHQLDDNHVSQVSPPVTSGCCVHFQSSSCLSMPCTKPGNRPFLSCVAACHLG